MIKNKNWIIFIFVVAFWAVLGLSQSTGPNAGVNRFNSGFTLVTKTSTALTTYTTNVKNIHCVNGSGADATLTVTDTAGNIYYPAVTITAGSTMVVNYGDVGLTLFGIKLSGSSATAISCQITGMQ